MLDHDQGDAPALRHLWLEVTGRCNLSCSHCYADSGPTRGHGGMSGSDWLRVIDEAGEIGVGTIQFIGGEATLHPDFERLVRRAAGASGGVEVYSNMVRVTPAHWAMYRELGVSLAASFYGSADAHDRRTGMRGSQMRTLRNIEGAVARGIPIRVAVINEDGEEDGDTAALLARAGVTDVSWDRVRGVGRGTVLKAEEQVDALCGNCTASSAAVDPEGEVYPCVFARAMSSGNVRAAHLGDVVGGAAMRRRLDVLREHFASKPPLPKGQQCTPCAPDACNPNTPHPKCNPLERTRPYDPGRPPDKNPFEKGPGRIKVPKIDPARNKPH